MQRIKVIGLTLVAVFAFSAVTVASASALLFHASSTGLLLGKLSGAAHKFKTNAGTVECTTATAHGIVSAKLSLHQLVGVNYSGCKLTIIGNPPATISEALYLFSADGLVAVENTITITPTGAGCNIKVGPAGNDLTTVGYKNSGNNLLVEANVTGITYTTTGGLCGTGGSNGTYIGTEEVFLDPSGTISVD